MFKAGLAALSLIAAVTLSTRRTTCAQTRPGEMPSLVIDSLYGADMFRFYCAPCHGRGGRGDGPVAEALKTRPADLTAIAARNGGVFPRPRVEAFVTNGPEARAVAAHGPSDMPVWGPTFLSLDPSSARAKVRISNLVDYLESLQRH